VEKSVLVILYLKTLGRTKECTHGRIKKILDVTCYCLYLKTLGRQKYLYKVEFTTNEIIRKIVQVEKSVLVYI
jgi:hypothetical protein